MALKAGRVGVNPSQVDMAGNVIGGGDTYTKLEIDQLLGSKVGIGQLEANNKDFYFAYDATTQKYGYKLDNEGDFHPFEEGGSGGKGWVTPPDLEQTGLTYNRCEYVEGGYTVDNNVVYLDIIVSATYTGSGASIKGSPRPGSMGGSSTLLAVRSGSTLNDVKSNDFYKETSYCGTQDNVGLINLPTVSSKGTYYRIYGEYPVYQ